MSQKINSHCAKCRRNGTKLMLKGEKCLGPKCPLTKRNYAPGQHGPTHKGGKLSGYGKQLREKQKTRQSYGLMEKQFSRFVKKAENMPGNSSDNLLTLLESRLDNVVYRAGFKMSRLSARQIIGHGHITVNGQKVNIPSFSVKVGDVISIKEGSKKSKMFENISETLSKAEPPAWLGVDAKAVSVKVLNTPSLENPNFDTKAIIEFYSR